MRTTGRPNYFDTFKPERVKRGKAISRREMTRRLAHYLQVPQRFGYRLMLAFEGVMQDAFLHGEGIKIPGAGVLTIERFTSDNYHLFNKIKPRKYLYKYQWTVTKSGQRYLEHISNLDRKGVVDDYFQDPEDN